jgi:hypothetical protein
MKPHNIELIKDAKPYHAKAFPAKFINRPCGLRWNDSAKSEFYVK